MGLQMSPCNSQPSFQLWAVLKYPHAKDSWLGCAEGKGMGGVYLASG